MIRLHSSLYVQNTTNFSLSFSLHLPSPFLTYSITPTPGDKLLNDYELLLRRMAPGHGFYLPLGACMDGVLALKPDRCVVGRCRQLEEAAPVVGACCMRGRDLI